MRLRRLRILGLLTAAGCAVLGVGAGGYAFVRHEHQCAPLRQNAEQTAPAAGPADGLRTLILGDSYTTGLGLPRSTPTWADLIAQHEDLHAVIDAYPGTGYSADGGCGGRPFGNRLQAVTARTRLVLVQGGLNDEVYDRPSRDVRSGARALVRAIRAAAPAARVVLIGPALPPSESAARVNRIVQLLRAVADGTGVRYIDLRKVAFGTVDGTHPDRRGQRTIARFVEAALHAQGAIASRR